LEFGSTFNLLVGKNAQGKTNIVESIGLISTGQSFRATDFRDMIMNGREAAEVRAQAHGTLGSDLLTVRIDDRRKTFEKNGKRAIASKSSRVCTVLFAPEEIMLLRQSPAARRRYMDTLISQLNPAHKTKVGKYERVLRQRNRLLGDPELSKSAKMLGLKPWDTQLVDLGAKIADSRSTWATRLNEFVPTHYEGIAPSDKPAIFEYAPFCGDEAISMGPVGIGAALADQLERRREDELTRGFTVVGPQRDDFEARIGTGEVKHYGSQGQHRSFVLALKMAEMSLFRDVMGEEPILLLDDVASELDSGRNRSFFESLRRARGQVFITATEENYVHLGKSCDARVFDVEAGHAAARK
jgi:DNA replication and repair protein RecF